VALAACGSDDSSSEPVGTQAVTTDPATSDPATSEPDGAGAVWQGIAPNTTPMSAEDSAAIDATFQEILDPAGDEVPGMWVGIWSAEAGQYSAAYGKAELGGADASIDDHGRIGSVTKTFTATAILKRVDSGELSLQDTIADILPDLAASYPDVAAITIDQLLGMQSGIPDYANTGLVIQQVVEDPTIELTASEIIDQVLTELDLEPAGTGGYSTTNYLILGEMLEAIDGRPVEEIVNEVVAEAGLTSSALGAPGDNTMPDPFSHGYVMQAGAEEFAEIGATVEPSTDVTDWTVSWGGAGGGMYSTIADLGLWAASGSGTSLLSEGLIEQRLTTRKTVEGLDYGLGIIDFGNGWIGHSGQLIGWEALVLYDTDTGDVAVAIVNETSSLIVAEVALATIFPDYGETLL
jgi:D-alanyl-D-alanine carboxypeptidase